MGLKYSMKIKVRCKEKLSDNKDRLLRETVETLLLTVFTNRTEKYEGGSRGTQHPTWDVRRGVRNLSASLPSLFFFD